MADETMSITTRAIVEVVKASDEYYMSVVRKYARKHAKERGERIELLFADADVVDEVITLGIAEYARRHTEQDTPPAGDSGR